MTRIAVTVLLAVWLAAPAALAKPAATPKPAKPAATSTKAPKASPTPDRLPHDVWVRGDNAVLVSSLSGSPTLAREKGFKLKRGTHLLVTTAPKPDKAHYYVTIDDRERYPFSGKFDHNVTGNSLPGYVDRSSVQDRPYNNFFGADQLYAKKAVAFKPTSGAPITLPPGTRLWALTGKKEGSRYKVRLDDFERFPNETKSKLEGYVEAADVAKTWTFNLPGRKK